MEGEPVNREPLAISRQPLAGRVAARRGFTLIELMVSVALLVAVILMVSQIFDISTRAASRTNAQSEVFSGAAAFRERISADVSRMMPGLLVIDSPPPTPVRAEVPGGEVIFRQRQDRIFFIAGGAPGQYESLTDPTRGEAYLGAPLTGTYSLHPGNWTPSASSAAMMYYGPSEPMDASGNPRQLDAPADPRPPTASEWVFVNRALLIGSEPNAGAGYFGNTVTPQPAWWPQYQQWRNTMGADYAAFLSSLTAAGPLTVPNNYLNGTMDVLFPFPPVPPNAIPMSPAELIDRLNAKLSGIAMAGMPGIQIQDLWQLGRAPVTATLRDPTAYDYYKRNGANFMPRMADIRIEWTDGLSVEPPPPYYGGPNAAPDLRTRWFGLTCDANNAPNPGNAASLNGLSYTARRRADPINNANNYYTGTSVSAGIINAYNTETDTFINQIESAPSSGSSAQYRAVWRTDNWQYRPKALRITYRLFDARNKMESDSTVDLDDDDFADPEGGTPYVVSRYGQEFSLIIPVP